MTSIIDESVRPGSNSTIRVVHISRWLSSSGGGIQTYLELLGECLSTTSVRNCYASLMADSLPDVVGDFHFAGVPSTSKFRNAVAMASWLFKHRREFDAFHIHGITDLHALIAIAICAFFRKPYVISIHGALFDSALSQVRHFPRITIPLIKLFSRGVLKRARCVVPTTDLEAALLRKLQPSIIQKVVSPGVRIPDISRISADPPQNSLRMLFIGRVEPVKALDHLIVALKLLADDGVDARLDVLGACDGAHFESMRDLVSRHDLQDRVFWHGYIGGADKQQWLRQASVLVLPSYSENFGFVAAEAMAMGVPVVVSSGVGLAQFVEEYHAGFVFPVADVAALKETLQKLGNPSVRRQYGENAYHAASTHLSLDHMRKMLLSVYFEMIPQQGYSDA